MGYGGGLPRLKAPTTFQLKSSTTRKFLKILSYQELLNPKIRILTCWELNPKFIKDCMRYGMSTAENLSVLTASDSIRPP